MVWSSPLCRKAREKAKAKVMELVKGTWAARKRAHAEEYIKDLGMEEELLAEAMGVYEEDSKKENWVVGEGSSHGILHLITPSPPPIPVPGPCQKPSFGGMTEDLSQQFLEGREHFLSGQGVPWLEQQMERSEELYAGGRGLAL